MLREADARDGISSRSGVKRLRPFGRFNPSTGDVQARCPRSRAEVERAIASATRRSRLAAQSRSAARRSCSSSSTLPARFDSLARVSSEHGKTIPTPRGTYSAGGSGRVAALRFDQGQFTEGAGPGIELYRCVQTSARRRNHPFNFPAMIPMWSRAGDRPCNTFVLKPRSATRRCRCGSPR